MKRDVAALIFMKTKPRNKMGDIFFKVNEDDIINTFMNFRSRRPNKKK